MNGPWQDFRYALRAFATPSNRLVTGVAALTLAVSIGLTTAIFSMVEALLLRSVPYHDPAQLMNVQLTTQALQGKTVYAHVANRELYQAWRSQSTAFEQLAAYSLASPVLTALGEARRVPTVAITSNMIPLLGARPLLGRTFLPEEDRAGANPVVILSAAFWSRNLASDPRALGRAVILGGRSYEIVGVMPPGFRVPLSIPEVRKTDGEVWVPMGLLDELTPLPPGYAAPVDVLGRLERGVTPEAAQAQLDRITRNVSATPSERENPLKFTQVVPLHRVIVGQVRTPLLLILGAVGLVLLIACANVASLLLGRAITRQREIAVRMALGASRARIARQLLTESVVLALAGGAGGVLLALWGVPLLVRLAGPRLPDAGEIGINAAVLVTALAVTTLTGILLGLAPALQAVRGTPPATLKEGTSGAGTSVWSKRVSGALVAGEVALTMMLLAGMGLLTQSFLQLTRTDRGYDVDRVLAAQIAIPLERYTAPSQRLAFARAVLERAQAIPGAVSVAVANAAPNLVGRSSTITVPGTPSGLGEQSANTWTVTEDYFQTLGIPLRRGRTLASADPDGIVIDEAAARAFFPGRDPIGQRLAWDEGQRSGTIVGVVGDIQELHVDTRDNTNRQTAEPHVYAPLTSDIGPAMSLVVRSHGDPDQLSATLRSTIAEVDPRVPLDVVASMRSIVSERFSRERFLVALTLIFATVALIMAAVGIYAVVAHATARRMREVGVRIALGAQRIDILALTMRQGLFFTAVGIGAGLAGTLVTTRLLRTLLFGVSATDPLVLTAVAVLLSCVALLASWLPARRATRADPMVALRSE